MAHFNRLGRIASVLANMAVVLGFIFVILQLQQSNRIALGSAEAEYLARGNAILQAVTGDIATAELAYKLSKIVKLDTAEEVQARFMARQYVNHWASAVRLHASQLMSEQIYEAQIIGMSGMLKQLPGLIPHLAYVDELNGSKFDGSSFWLAYCTRFREEGFSKEAKELNCP